MKLKNYLPLAVASLAMVACNNDDEIVNGPDLNNSKAYAAVSISLPTGTETRAEATVTDPNGDTNALAGERGISTVTLYVDGNDPITIDAADFTWAAGKGIAKKAYEVTGKADTTASAYVVINQVQPTGSVPMQWKYFGQTTPLVYNNLVSKLTGENMFTMFSKAVATVNLKATEGEAIATGVPAEVTVQRAAAKVLVTDNKGYLDGDVAVTNGQGTIVQSSLKWYIGNSNRSLYCTPQLNNADPNYTFADKDWDDFNNDFEQLSKKDGSWRELDGGGTALTRLIAVAPKATTPGTATKAQVLYCNENTNATKEDYKVSNTTYVLLAAQYVPTKLMNSNIGGTADIPTVTSDGLVDGSTVKGETFYVHKASGFYFTVAGKTAYETKWGAAADKFYEYKDAKCYYRINLKDTAKNLGVLRNHYYTMAIGDIKGLGSWTDPVNPVNPNIPGGTEEPAEPENSLVSVNITVEPWALTDMGTVSPL